LTETFGERFKTPDLLREMADKNQSFYGRFGAKSAAA
jgi:3-hydroxyacyl-CoA dehydrogenase/enoyl-CoA hydratase/3-hydroxybutyryl-CoA epimerase